MTRGAPRQGDMLVGLARIAAIYGLAKGTPRSYWMFAQQEPPSGPWRDMPPPVDRQGMALFWWLSTFHKWYAWAHPRSTLTYEDVLARAEQLAADEVAGDEVQDTAAA